MRTRGGGGGRKCWAVSQLECENCQFWSQLVKIKLEWGSDFWNWELEPGLKLDPILEPELNLHGSKTRTRIFGEKKSLEFGGLISS
jgi:hypothetical protein